MAERGFKNLNASVLRQISKVLEQDSEADIESILHKVYTSYATLRRAVSERQVKRTSEYPLREERRSPKKFKPSIQDSSSPNPPATRSSPPTEARLRERLSLSASLPHAIVFPLSPIVQAILNIGDGRETELSSAIVTCVLSGAVIWGERSRAVIQIGETVAVKVTDDANHDEYGILQYLEQHIPSVPAPRPLGLITVGPVSLMFMTVIPGDTLETRWPALSVEAKGRIRRVLDDHLAALRSLQHPPGSTFGAPTGRRLCKDVRRDERLSASPICSETQFNDFLLDSPGSRAAPSYKHWLRSMLRVDHRILFTHADFHPRNIMVVTGSDGTVELSGILDWEASGFYPEYWEQLKAMNTRSVKDTSDWWDYLPPSILGYDQEVMLDRVIETTVVY